jgi:hypothetical protein
MKITNIESFKSKFPVTPRFYVVFTISQVVLNIALYTFLLKGTEPKLIFILATVGFLIIHPIASCLIGSLIALIPYKGISYNGKYFPSVLLVYFLLNSVVSVAILIGLGRFIITGTLN